ncbi:MAG: protein kinase [Labilithrix sp.]|nr:protein kinase [Labilithrix sp.]MCW5814502.1 protein kinase [Labilithrix sp.]
MNECPDEATILAFGRGEGDSALRRAVEVHLAECDECRALVSAVVRSSSLLPKARPIDVMAPTTPVQGGADTVNASSVVAPVKSGDVLAGKYVVERILGAGGMGVVVAARHLQLDQRVALKFLLPAACENADAVARFLREGKAAARITSEHVARVVDTGVLESGAPYLVMEYLEGADLGALASPLAPEDAVEYVLQACEAIVEAHELGIVHRDLKPANLFLARRKDGSPLVKVLDFGISKTGDGSASTQLTSTATMMGSPRYMSPEQMLSAKDVDARSDVWALGVILFELVTGRAVWEADTIQGLCAMIATAPPPSLRQLVPGASPLLEDVIHRCLAKSPDQRVPSVADLALLLAPLASAPAQTSIDRILRVAGLFNVGGFAPDTPTPDTALALRARGASRPLSRPLLGPHDGAARAVVSQPPESIRAPVEGGGKLVGALAVVIVAVAVAAGALFVMRREDAPPVPAATAPPPPASEELPAAVAKPPSASVPSAAQEVKPAPSTPAAKPKVRRRPPPAADTDKPAPPPPPPGPDPAMTDRK